MTGRAPERPSHTTMIDLRYVKKLIDMLDGSSVDSIEISSDKGMKIRISKTPSQRGTVQMAAPLPLPARRRWRRAARATARGRRGKRRRSRSCSR
jgi:hypothetical protein